MAMIDCLQSICEREVCPGNCQDILLDVLTNNPSST